MPCKHSFVHIYLQFCCSVSRRIGFWVGGGPTRLQRWSWFRSSQEKASRVFAPKRAVNRKRSGRRMAAPHLLVSGVAHPYYALHGRLPKGGCQFSPQEDTNDSKFPISFLLRSTTASRRMCCDNVRCSDDKRSSLKSADHHP